MGTKRETAQAELGFTDPANGDDKKHFERLARHLGYSLVAGVDEAGRGALAGPVVAAAVIFPRDYLHPGIDDSKALSPETRGRLLGDILAGAQAVGWGVVDNHAIDRENILRASLRAMTIAVEMLRPAADFLLVDGQHRVPIPLEQRAVVHGDALSLSIAAASIVAKVLRDRIMGQYHQQYPGYGFDRNKGYGTRPHLQALVEHGPCAEHRLTFKGVVPLAGPQAQLLFSPGGPESGAGP